MMKFLQVGPYCIKKDTPHGIYFLNINNGSTRKIREICSKLTIKSPERRHLTSFWCLFLFTLNKFHIFFGVYIAALDKCMPAKT